MECADHYSVPLAEQFQELTPPLQVMAVMIKTGARNSAGKATKVPLSSPQEELGAPVCDLSLVHQSAMGSGLGQAQPTLTLLYPAQHTGAGSQQQMAVVPQWEGLSVRLQGTGPLAAESTSEQPGENTEAS